VRIDEDADCIVEEVDNQKWLHPDRSGEPTTSRLIPTCRDSTIEQMFPDPAGRLHGFYLPFAVHRSASSGMRFAPNQSPGAVFACEFALDFVGTVVGLQTEGEIIGLADVKHASGILEYVGPEHGAKTKEWLQR